MLQFKKVPCHSCDGLGVKTVPDPESLQAIRKKAGISLREFARRIGLSAGHISDVEHGYRGCTPEIEMAYRRLDRQTNNKKGK